MFNLISHVFQMASGQEPKGPPLLPTARSYNTLNEPEPSGETSFDDSAETASTVTNDDGSSNSSKNSAWRHPRVVSDIIIGLSDGLTVPFALTAGLSSLGNTRLVVTGGLAELVAGAISMGLGGYLAATSELEYYNSQIQKEKKSYDSCNMSTVICMEEVLKDFGCLSQETIAMFSQDMQKDPDNMIEFVVKHYREADEPASNRQLISAITIGMSYFIGGFIPLIPYFFVHEVVTALIISVIIMAVTLFAFGVAKTLATIGRDCSKLCLLWNGVKMTLVGGIAAGAAYGLVRAIE